MYCAVIFVLSASLSLILVVGQCGSETCVETVAERLFGETAGLLQKSTTQTVKREHPEGITLPMAEDEIVLIGPTGARKTPLCDPTIVASTCTKLNGGKHAELVSAAQIQTVLSLNRSTTDAIWKALSFEPLEKVNCIELCHAVIELVPKLGGVLPTSSDEACYTLQGSTNCDVDVEPHSLVKKVGEALASRPNMNYTDEIEVEPDVTTGLLQHRVTFGAHGLTSLQHRTNSGTGGTISKDFCPYTLWQVVELIANFFHVFPSHGADVSIFTGDKFVSASSSIDAKIARIGVQAKAWVATVLVELANQRTEPFRDEWFGGNGDLNAAAVRDRILLAFNFIERELDDVRYVYPADSASDTGCGGNTVAYVWKWVSDVDGYDETRGPKCNSQSDDPMMKSCAVDESGRYYVYLCEYWNDLNMNIEIAALVHEAAHHTGPSDVTYDTSLMKTLSQAEQLNNAASYENFAGDVAQSAWGCADADAIPGYSCRRGDEVVPCPCSVFENYCSTSADIRRQCPATCGDCLAPTPEPPTPEPTPKPPTSRPTQAPTLAPTSEPTQAPSLSPTSQRTQAPALSPTSVPTQAPALSPTPERTQAPALSPTLEPTPEPPTLVSSIERILGSLR